MGKILSSKYEQKLLRSSKKSAADALKILSKGPSKNVRSSGYKISTKKKKGKNWKKISEKIMKAASKSTHEDADKTPMQINETQ